MQSTDREMVIKEVEESSLDEIVRDEELYREV